MERFDVPQLIITDAMASHAKWHPNKMALICEDRKLTWREFNKGINKVANALLNLGLQKGDKVSILMKNSIEMAEIMYGVVRAGGVMVAISTMLPIDSIIMMVNDSDSKYFFVDTSMLGIVAPYKASFQNIAKEGFIAVDTEADGWNSYKCLIQDVSEEEPGILLYHEDNFNIIYSSGTTGVPKGILHTHYGRQQFAVVLGFEYRMDNTTISIASSPMYTNGTNTMFMPVFLLGGTVVIMPSFNPHNYLELVQKERVTHTFLVPTQLIALMSEPDFDKYDLTSLKVIVTGGSPLFKETKEEVRKKFRCDFIELWGLTEGVATNMKPQDMNGEGIGCVGTPPMGGDIRIINDKDQEVPRGEIGEIIGYSSIIMPEYYKQPEKTAEAIWKDERGRTYLKTGDIGKLDEETGFLYILDRKKDMIISGGINIFASDIEDVILRHPAVAEVGVIGIPHEKWIETPLALVVLKKAETASAEEIMNWTNTQLAKYQRISGVEFRDNLPRNPLGKILKRELREPYWDKLE